MKTVLRRVLRNVARSERHDPLGEMPHGTRPADWYDWSYRETPAYQCHYTDSGYYFLWTVVADRLRRSGAHRVLDLGCGPGQFASLLYDMGFRDYRGIDFSGDRILAAQSLELTGFRFIQADLADPASMESHDYDAVVTMEFLEHVEFDLAVLSRIKPGARVLATVPNFPYVSHVRYFKGVGEVKARYGAHFKEFAVDALLENTHGKTFYLIDGVKA